MALTWCFSGAEGTRTPDPLHAMQVRYQLRHSPRSVAVRMGLATRGILANGVVRSEIAPAGVVGVRADGGGLVVGHQAQATLDVMLPEHRPAAVVHAAQGSGHLGRPAE